MHKFFYLLFFFFFITQTFSQQQTDNRFIVTDQINNLLQERGECKNTKKTKKYYHIQLYNGQNLDRAKKIKQDFISKFEDIPVMIEWESPEFKVWVGVYENKLSADQALIIIRKEYPNAFIVNPKK
jgi:hypothetical protein